MSTESQNVLANFDSLPAADRQWVADEIMRRANQTEADEDSTSGGYLSTEDFIERFHAWAYSHPPIRNPNLDDSREAMYEGCGE